MRRVALGGGTRTVRVPITHDLAAVAELDDVGETLETVVVALDVVSAVDEVVTEVVLVVDEVEPVVDKSVEVDVVTATEVPERDVVVARELVLETVDD